VDGSSYGIVFQLLIRHFDKLLLLHSVLFCTVVEH